MRCLRNHYSELSIEFSIMQIWLERLRGCVLRWEGWFSSGVLEEFEGLGGKRESEIQTPFSLHAKLSYQGRIVCLSTCKWFCARLTVRLILSLLHFHQEDVQLWLSHVAFCKQWVSFQNTNLASVKHQSSISIGHLELELQDRGTNFTAICCIIEIILIVLLELPGIFNDVCKCGIWLSMN